MSVTECIAAFKDTIWFLNLFALVAMAVGVLVILVVLFLIVTRKRVEVSWIVILLLGVAVMGAGAIKKLPVPGGKIDSVNIELGQIIDPINWCVAAGVKTAPISADAASNTSIPVSTTGNSSIDLSSFQVDLTWIFYGAGRKDQAFDLYNKISQSGLKAQPPSRDDFGGVKMPWQPGQIRVIFSDNQYKSYAEALVQYLKAQNSGSDVLLNGPIPTVLRKPVQVHFY